MRKSSDDVLRFWFGRLESEGFFPVDRADLWYANDPNVDKEVEQIFASTVEFAQKGALSQWKLETRGLLAVVLLLERYTKYMYRGTPAMYATDLMAVQQAKWGITRGMDRSLYPIERAFLYWPLVNVEDENIVREGVQKYERLLEESPPAIHMKIDGFCANARRNLELIERFGRFPERNAVLGRPNTPEEQEYLDAHAIAS